VDSWITRLDAAACYADAITQAVATFSDENESIRTSLQEQHRRQAIEAKCRSGIAFLKGPRQLRDRFGSALNSSDISADVIFQEGLEIHHAAIEDVSRMCRLSQAARNESPPTLDTSSIGIQHRADLQLITSDCLLAKCEELMLGESLDKILEPTKNDQQVAQHLWRERLVCDEDAKHRACLLGKSPVNDEMDNELMAARVRTEASEALERSALYLASSDLPAWCSEFAELTADTSNSGAPLQ